ncbi:MAG: o-succinylbenzoate synthase [Demequinaceae bacterium]|nr:o-succinylbenzoate synthase [Demequinaceae bacterium]
MEFRPFRVPLVIPFRGLTERSGVLVRGRRPDGSEAWGEYSPFPDYDARRASLWWNAAMEAARGEWPEPVRDAVAVNSIVPDVEPGQVAGYATAGGCIVAKVKVAGRGSTLDRDCRRVEAAAEAVAASGSPEAKVRIDANGAWGVDEAVSAIDALNRAAVAGGVGELEYVEQPCAAIEDLVAVRRKVGVPIAADESVRLPEDPLAVARSDAADILVLKVAPLGGVRACLRIAEEAGLPVVVSSAMETSVGLAAGLALALALPQLEYASGLGTASLLVRDTVTRPLRPRDGVLCSTPPEVIA